MRTLVIYDSKFGNTARIARAIANGARASGTVDVLEVEAVTGALPEADLLLVGGPTRNHGITPVLRGFLEGLGSQGLRGVRAAAFDTRYRMATLLSGSAARDASGRLARAGARAVAGPESFFMSRAGKPEAQALEGGELERAEGWGRRVAILVASELGT